MADERSVDVDERRDPAPDDGSRTPLVAATVKLSPLQEAYSSYARHHLRCPTCSDIDAGRCEEAVQLWRAWRTASDAAGRQLRGETA